ncbi:outer membrane beta-barrel protein [Pedobacter sp. N23S346]|uniref:outer membrane beta-barrel protein n=1 Tax=Pedobacter sp. N23S346 TaxID=3402750 RepID=UPI003ABE19A9
MNKKGKMKDEHNLDKLFKEGMEEVDIPFREEDWMAMSEKLDQQEKKTRFPIWWSILTAAAASILIFFVFFNAPKKIESAKRIEKSQEKIVELKNTPVELPVDRKTDQQENVNQVPFVTRREVINVDSDTGLKILQPVNIETVIGEKSGNLIALIESKMKSTALQGVSVSKSKPADEALLKMVQPQRLSFTLMAAPDISSTSSSINNKVSTNVGLMINYALTRKISLSTGVIYAKKLYDYNSRGRLVAGYKDTNWNVEANCKVLDLPVNIDYRVFKKRNIAVNVSAGVSSYLMLNEKYKLTTGPALTVTREEVTGNKHFLGIANFSVSVERNVNSRLSVGLQPFLKLPLTGIGKYEGNLSSAGLSVLLNIKNLN